MSYTVLTPQAPGSENYTVLEPDNPSWADVLSPSNRGPQAGLSYISAAGGAIRAASDLFGWKSAADFGASLARNARGTAQDLNPDNQTLPQQAVAGGIDSAMQMLPAMLLGGPAAGYTMAAGQTGFSRYSELRDSGFSPGRSGFHAAIDAAAEYAGERYALPVLWKSNKPFMAKTLEFMTKDLVGEELTTFVQGLNSKFSDRPDKTVGDFLNDALLTAMTVPIAATVQSGMHRGAQAAMGAIAPQQPEVPPPAPTPPPVVVPQTPEAPTPTAPPPDPVVTPGPVTPPPATPDPVVPDPAPVGQSPSWMPNSFATPPDEQIKAGAVDLLLYNELLHPKVMVEATGGDAPLIKVTASQAGSTIPTTAVYSDYESAATALAAATGIRLDQQTDMLNSLWVERITKNMLDRNGVPLSNSALQFVQGIGAEAVVKSLANVKTIYGTPAIHSPGQYTFALYDDPVKHWPTPVTQGGLVVSNMQDVPDQVFLADNATKNSPTAKAMAARLAGWAKAFGVQSKILLEFDPNMKTTLGHMRASMHGDAFKVTMNPKNVSGEGGMLTLAHEFGHGLAFSLFRTADPAVQLKVIRDWAHLMQKEGATATMAGVTAQAGVTRAAGSFGRYAETSDDVARARSQQPASKETASDRQRYNKDIRYVTSFSEHLADQVAQYMFDKGMTFSPEEKTFYEKVVAKLKAFYASVVHKYDPNISFYEWLDTLRSNAALIGIDDTVTIETIPTPIEPDQGKVTDKAGMLVINDIAPAQEKYWKKRRDKMLAELEDLLDEDRFDALLEEIDPTGLLKNFDFDRAIKELEKHGADPKTFMSRELASIEDLDAELEEILQEFGKHETYDGALRALSNGDRVFTAHEQDEQLFEVFSPQDMENYSASDFLVLSRFFTGSASREPFMPQPAVMDDTYPVRAQLTALQKAIPGLAGILAPARESTKSFGSFLRSMLTAVQVRKRYGDTVPAIKQGVDAIEMMEAYKAKLRTRADDRIKQMKELGRTQREKVFAFMIKEDKAGNWLSVAVPNAGNGARMIMPDVAKAHGITDEGGKLYAELRKDFWDALKELEHLRIVAVEKNANAQDPISLAKLQETIKNIRKETNDMLANPYVPHTRFGNYYTQIVDPSTGKIQEFYQFEKKSDAKKWTEKLRKEGKNASTGMIREDVKSFAGLPPSLINSMKESLNLTDEQARAFEDLLKNMSGGQSFVRKMKKRKDIPGWAEEEHIFPQVYADYMTKFANHAGRMKFAGKLKQSELDLKQMIRDEAMFGRDTTNLGQLLNWLQKTNEYAMHPTSEWANIRGAVTVWYLGFSAKSAVVNGLSVPMVTYPYLASRFGDVKAIAAISRAYSDIARQFVKPGVLAEDEKLFLENLRQQNTLDESYSAELAGIREGGRLADTFDLTPKAAMSTTKYYGMWMFHKMEMANRYATALSAYRLARTQMAFDDPVPTDRFDKQASEFAKSTIQDTQNVNAQWNRSEFTRGGKSVLTMFMSYQQNLMFQMFGGDQSWMRLLAVQMLMAGMMGIPFAKDADNLIKWFARKVLGDDFSPEQYVREHLSNIMSNPNWLLRGASYNVFGKDLQGSLSMGNVIPGLDALAQEGSFAERLANAAPDIGGPAFATMLSFMQAMADNNPDSTARFTRMLPAAAKQLSQGWTMFQEGVAKNGRGDPIADVTKSDAIGKMLGFQPTAASVESAKRFAEKDTARYWLTERQYILQVYYMAVKTHDGEMRGKAHDLLMDYNSRVPEASLKIGGKEVAEGIKSRFAADQKDAMDMPKSMRDFPLYRDIAQRY